MQINLFAARYRKPTLTPQQETPYPLDVENPFLRISLAQFTPDGYLFICPYCGALERTIRESYFSKNFLNPTIRQCDRIGCRGIYHVMLLNPLNIILFDLGKFIT